MRKSFTYLLVVIMSALVFYGGAGINVISYCCKDCRSTGIEVIASRHDPCCKDHGNHCKHKTDNTYVCGVGDIRSSQEDCCGIERLQYDWSMGSESDMDLEPETIDLLFADFIDISVISSLTLKAIFVVIPTEQLFKPPRTYLSLLTTLLI